MMQWTGTLLRNVACFRLRSGLAMWYVHRWPKRNIIGDPVRNMRVCMGEIEFET